MKKMLFPILFVAIFIASCSTSNNATANDDAETIITENNQPNANNSQEIIEEPIEIETEVVELQAPSMPVIEMGNCDEGINPGANLALCNFYDSNLSNSVLVGANISQATFSDSNMKETDFSNTIAIGTIWSSCNISGTIFDSADLTLADLSGNNLSGASFVNADLSFANLSGINGTFADFTGANLTGADLSVGNLLNAILSQEQIEQANVTGSVLPDGSIGE